MPALRLVNILDVLAVCLLGLMAGFFFAFAVDVAPAMAHLDAACYVTAQQWINRVVRNAVFGAAYFGSAVLPFVTAAAAFFTGQRGRALAWFAISLVYFIAVFWLTRAINVPLNEELAAWSPANAPPSWTEARDKWNLANLVRSAAAGLCFLCATVLLALSGRRA